MFLKSSTGGVWNSNGVAHFSSIFNNQNKVWYLPQNICNILVFHELNNILFPLHSKHSFYGKKRLHMSHCLNWKIILKFRCAVHCDNVFLPEVGTCAKIWTFWNKLDVQNCNFFCRNFLHNHPFISTPFSTEKHPILLTEGFFYHNLLKIHSIYVI